MRLISQIIDRSSGKPSSKRNNLEEILETTAKSFNKKHIGSE